MTLAERLAYLAGIVDGEGYVGIKRTKAAPGPVYRERIQVRMVEDAAIRMLLSTFGGSCTYEKPHAHRGRPLYCWQLSDVLACKALELLLPYLKIKRAQAENVLALRASKEDPRARLRGGPSRRRMPDDIRELREALYLRAKALNGRGGAAEYGSVSAGS